MVIAVANNGAWQVEVYDHQVARGRVVGTKLEFSNQAAMARAFGLHGERVEKPEELPGAVDRAFANPAALLDVVVTPRAVSSDARTGLAWVPDLRPLAAWDEAERKWRQGCMNARVGGGDLARAAPRRSRSNMN
jgi:Thiamine pyrophosphate enzyme, C-terminal TPP binding domain